MSRDLNEVNRARFRMALWLLIFFVITLVEGSLTFPFVGHVSSLENLTYGIAVAAPFWISIILFLAIARKDKKTE